MILDSSELVKLYHELHWYIPTRRPSTCFHVLWRTISFIIMLHIYETYTPTADSFIYFCFFFGFFCLKNTLKYSLQTKESMRHRNNRWKEQKYSITTKTTLPYTYIQIVTIFCVCFKIHQLTSFERFIRGLTWHTFCLLFCWSRVPVEWCEYQKMSTYTPTFFSVVPSPNIACNASWCFFFLNSCVYLCMCFFLFVCQINCSF